jgi:hypothetical protein
MNDIGFRNEYVAGVNSFLDFISARLSTTADIRCPYNKCCNQYYKSQHVMREHLLISGRIQPIVSGYIMEKVLMHLLSKVMSK